MVFCRETVEETDHALVDEAPELTFWASCVVLACVVVVVLSFLLAAVVVAFTGGCVVVPCVICCVGLGEVAVDLLVVGSSVALIVIVVSTDACGVAACGVDGFTASVTGFDVNAETLVVMVLVGTTSSPTAQTQSAARKEQAIPRSFMLGGAGAVSSASHSWAGSALSRRGRP